MGLILASSMVKCQLVFACVLLWFLAQVVTSIFNSRLHRHGSNQAQKDQQTEIAFGQTQAGTASRVQYKSKWSAIGSVSASNKAS